MRMKDQFILSRMSLLLWTGLAVLTTRPALATDSGGPLMPEQAAYDVTFYDLALTIRPDSKTLEGALTVQADILEPLRWFVLDLDDPLDVSRVARINSDGTETDLFFERRGLRIWTDLGETLPAGNSLRIAVYYGGTPHEALNPPWEGGLVWQKHSSRQTPWVAVACQNEGADIWWPCKDHPSDEPDSMALHFRVPETLVCASNGRLRSVDENGDGTKTWHWFSGTPINAYNVTVNLGPYRVFEDSMILACGDTLPIRLYLLPNYATKGTRFLKQMKNTIVFLESLYGPYPFRIDKYGVVQTPFAGMEHQTITAYGGAFQFNDFGFDFLLFHETAHEWWGNMLTNSDWKDMWLHEGFTTYTEALYSEFLNGAASLHEYVSLNFRYMDNRMPLAPEEPTSIDGIYSGDVYTKGAYVLHTLRYLVGDDLFFRTMRRMLYPTPESESVKTGGQCRTVDSEEFIAVAERISGLGLGWFFDVYLRQTALPELRTRVEDDTLFLTWHTESGAAFPMPVDVKIGGNTQRVIMTDGSGRIELDQDVFEIDPMNWVLKTGTEPRAVAFQTEAPAGFSLLSAFPNPFNSRLTCVFDLRSRQAVQVNIYDSRGRLVERLLDETRDAGRHHVSWDAPGQPSGMYMVRLETREGVQTFKAILMK